MLPETPLPDEERLCYRPPAFAKGRANLSKYQSRPARITMELT
jgi:hypothetical protein